MPGQEAIVNEDGGQHRDFLKAPQPPSASSSTQLKKNGVCVEDLLRRTGYVCPISLKL